MRSKASIRSSKQKVSYANVLDPVSDQVETPVEVVVEPRDPESQNEQPITPDEPVPDIIIDNSAPQEFQTEGPRRVSVNAKVSKTRLVMINYHQTEKYASNRISTAKYSVWSFLPFFLYEQFRRYSNIFFLGIALLQQIPDVSPTGRWTTLVPFLAILSISAIKEIFEDVKRHRGDKDTNQRIVEVLINDEFECSTWNEVSVGQFVKILNNNFFPADIVVFCTSEPLGVCYIETSNLDGETNLKVRQARPETTFMDVSEFYAKARGFIECGLPNRELYEFSGSLKLESANVTDIGLGPDQLLLRGAKLRNTKWIIGQVIYTGSETKLMKNSTKVPLKRSTLDKKTNYQIIILFILLIVIALTSAAFSEFYVDQETIESYVGKATSREGRADMAQDSMFFYNFLTFIILFNNLIPISLTVTLEVVRSIQALFINWDQDMYHLESNVAAVARTSNLNEELGQIRYIFSDKTGTLTRNVMEFKGCSVGGVYYDPETMFPPEESQEDCPLIKNLLKQDSLSESIRDFLVVLSVCHNVIPEVIRRSVNGNISEEIRYHAASPDEKALVEGACQLGFTFVLRTPQYVEISVMDKGTERYEILSLIEFTSTRKRMTVIARCPDGQIRLFCKGADSVIYERLSRCEETLELCATTQTHLQAFATTGLRTLCCAMKTINKDDFSKWNDTFQTAANSINNREAAIDAAAELIETDLTLLGVTAIEDKLQDFVPETIAFFLEADIRVWVLTGDKQETAINIGYSCRLLTPSMTLLMMNQETELHTSECIHAYANEMSISLSSFTTKEAWKKIVTQNTALIVDGKTLTYALSDHLRHDFICLCCNCKAVIVCRAAPIQKAEVVEAVTKLTGAITLAVGDGANDVAMIQKAHVGVGIAGKEGLQAAGSSDYSIAQFSYLKKLIFVHGAWNHNRITKTVFYSFYKNICLYIIELWFAIYSAWSGQVIFERWTIGCYNMLFTCFQPIAIGLFDRNCSMKLRLENPELYHSSSGAFNMKQFFYWVLNSVIHSIFLFWLTQLFIGSGVIWGNGMEGSYLVLGNFIYTYVVVVVSLKAGLETSAWTKFTHWSIWGSILLWLLFLLGYSYMWHFSSLGAEISGIADQVFNAPVFWFGLIIIPTATLLPDVVYKAIQGTCFRTMVDDFREEDVTNPNQRPSREIPSTAHVKQEEPTDYPASVSVLTAGPPRPERQSEDPTGTFLNIFNRPSSASIFPTIGHGSLQSDPGRQSRKSILRYRDTPTSKKKSVFLAGSISISPEEEDEADETAEPIENIIVLKYIPSSQTISRTSLVPGDRPKFPADDDDSENDILDPEDEKLEEPSKSQSLTIETLEEPETVENETIEAETSKTVQDKLDEPTKDEKKESSGGFMSYCTIS